MWLNTVYKTPPCSSHTKFIYRCKVLLIEAILTDFKNATLTSLYIFQNTVVCKISLLQ